MKHPGEPASSTHRSRQRCAPSYPRSRRLPRMAKTHRIRWKFRPRRSRGEKTSRIMPGRRGYLARTCGRTSATRAIVSEFDGFSPSGARRAARETRRNSATLIRSLFRAMRQTGGRDQRFARYARVASRCFMRDIGGKQLPRCELCPANMSARWRTWS